MAAPVVWLALLQVNYVLAYPSCADRSNAWLHAATAAGLLLAALIAAGAIHVWRSEPAEQREGVGRMAEQRDAMQEDPSAAARHFLSIVGLLLTGLVVLLVIGTWVPPLLLHPCD